MILLPVAKHYARALLELAREKGVVDQIGEGLRIFREKIEEDRRILNLFSSPVISQQEKEEFLETLIGEVEGKELLKSFLALLVKNKRVRLLEQIVYSYKILADEVMERVDAVAVSPVPLSEEQKMRLAERLSLITGKKVNLRVEEDPSILGGVVVKVEGKIYDGSIKGFLRSLRQVLCEE